MLVLPNISQVLQHPMTHPIAAAATIGIALVALKVLGIALFSATGLVALSMATLAAFAINRRGKPKQQLLSIIQAFLKPLNYKVDESTLGYTKHSGAVTMKLYPSDKDPSEACFSVVIFPETERKDVKFGVTEIGGDKGKKYEDLIKAFQDFENERPLTPEFLNRVCHDFNPYWG